MKRCALLLLILVLILLAGCVKHEPDHMVDGDGMEKHFEYTQISQEEAMKMMAVDDGHIVVDVRRQDEYDSGHIPGAILIPNESITDKSPEALPDRDQIILIYCRSGNRSKDASQKLADMGYSRVYEFGGINTWPGEITPPVEEAPVLIIEANGRTFRAMLENNSSAEALAEKLKEGQILVKMTDYGNFEKVGPLPWNLPANDEQITTSPGDVILYQGDKITVYYDENSWNFTRLARIGNVTREDLLAAFGKGDVTMTFRLELNK